MQYTKEQRLDIGRQIYDGELSRSAAAEKYEITEDTARSYMRQYRDLNNLPPKTPKHGHLDPSSYLKNKIGARDLAAYEAMTKEQLLMELVKSRVAEARLKKGYEVKGDGTVIRYSKKNTR